jgi:EAL domain-containing protein (putative c-di-GMP-specific phosphodiesterase class I)
VFHTELTRRAVDRLDLELELRRAIEEGELELVYQPLVDLHTDRIEAVEALVRWEHPVRGLLAPGDFIPLAEECGLIVPLGAWVLEAACQQGRDWLDQGLVLEMAVNLSAHQFQRQDLVAVLRGVLDRTGLPAEQLLLEITETVVMQEADAAVRAMREIAALGVRLALDDFGQGYSSLSHLRRFPLASVKIDKVFVDGITNASEDRAIVTSVVALAAALGVDVTAEGIETPDQLRWAKKLGVDLGQGFLISRPVPAAAIPDIARAARISPIDTPLV